MTLRHTNEALLDGDYVAPERERQLSVYTYLRRYKNQAVLVVLNMSDSPQKVSLDAVVAGVQCETGEDIGSHKQGGSPRSRWLESNWRRGLCMLAS